MVVNFDRIDELLTKFSYFERYSQDIRKKMMAQCYLRIYKKGELIYNQGDPSPYVFFILRGSVEVSVVKNDLGNLPVVIKILYEGQEFGEYVNL